jgi:hypothetical protein
MATLTIEGREVDVDDSFLTMTPDAQNAAVEEIASALGSVANDAPGPDFDETFSRAEAGRGDAGELFAPQLQGMDETDIAIARSKNTPLGGYLRQQALQPQEGETQEQMQARQFGGLPDRPAHDGFADQARTFVHNTIDGVPVIGGKIADHVAATGVFLANPEQGYGRSYDAAQALADQDAQDNPYTAMAGQFTGAVAPMIAAGATPIGAKALGMSGGMAARIGASGASGAAIAAADTAARGGGSDRALDSALVSGSIGAALPIVGAGIRAAGRGVANKAGPVIQGLVNPEKAAAKQVGRAMNADGAAMRLSAADEAIARQNGQPIINADRGGERTLALVKSIANQSPSTRQKIADFAGDRYAAQSDRATSFLSRVMGGAIDDLAAQDALKSAALKANKPAYSKAFKSPEAQAMWTPRLQELMQSPAMQDAAKTAAGRGANRAAVEGFKPIRNPFTFNQDGTFALAPAKNGAQAVPSLQFWDQTKRNLDGMIGTAQRQGDKTLAADLTALHRALVDELDSAVPAYASARRGAAGFFDAEDALEAGKKFVNINRAIPETKRAIMKMSAPEREAFATGFAAELKDKILQAGDSVDLVKRVFGSPESRQKIEMALGRDRFKQFQGFMHVETTMNALQKALGGSTTTRQLMELGLAGGGGYYASDGDMKTAAATALLAFGVRKGITKANDRTMASMAEMLLSDSPAKIGVAIRMASGNENARAALDKIGFIARAINMALAEDEKDPLQVTIPVGSSQQMEARQ